VGLTIGQIDYANCFPIFSALQKNFDCSAYRFVRGTPATLNKMLLSGEIDLCPSSSIAYARSAEKYRLIPGLSISSIGSVKSVFLFSRVPIEKLDGMPIGLTVESATSIALLKIILKKYYRFTNRFFPVVTARTSAETQCCPAILVIGDTALKWSQDFSGLYRYDLGALWLSLTGLPFVFALWMIRDDVVVRMPEEAARIKAHLLAAKELAVSTLETLAAESGEYAWMNRETLLDYWKTISYDLTPWHVEGARSFFRDAAETGILEREPALRFL